LRWRRSAPWPFARIAARAVAAAVEALNRLLERLHFIGAARRAPRAARLSCASSARLAADPGASCLAPNWPLSVTSVLALLPPRCSVTLHTARLSGCDGRAVTVPPISEPVHVL
jgi:hypothetical protein